MIFISIFGFDMLYFLFKITYYSKFISRNPLLLVIGAFNTCFESLQNRRTVSVKAWEFVLTFSYYHKTEKVIERLLRTLVTLSKLSIKGLSLFLILFRLIKYLMVKRDLMESSLNSFQAP